MDDPGPASLRSPRQPLSAERLAGAAFESIKPATLDTVSSSSVPKDPSLHRTVTVRRRSGTPTRRKLRSSRYLAVSQKTALPAAASCRRAAKSSCFAPRKSAWKSVSSCGTARPPSPCSARPSCTISSCQTAAASSSA